VFSSRSSIPQPLPPRFSSIPEPDRQHFPFSGVPHLVFIFLDPFTCFWSSRGRSTAFSPICPVGTEKGFLPRPVVRLDARGSSPLPPRPSFRGAALTLLRRPDLESLWHRVPPIPPTTCLPTPPRRYNFFLFLSTTVARLHDQGKDLFPPSFVF